MLRRTLVLASIAVASSLVIPTAARALSSARGGDNGHQFGVHRAIVRWVDAGLLRPVPDRSTRREDLQSDFQQYSARCLYSIFLHGTKCAVC